MTTSNSQTPPVVRLQDISKSFGPVKANQNISLDINAGKVLALLGENGAGKSTLMNMLSGVFPPDSGHILLDGQEHHFESPKDAIQAGIGMVYQHFKLVNSMTVAQNVLLGQEGSFIIRPREMEARVDKLAKRYGLDIDPAAIVNTLSMGERQRVEILKLLYRDSRVLIFDEPTAVLTPGETDQLFQALKQMTSRGKAIVFISHKLKEVLQVSDAIAILRRGEIVDNSPRSQITSKAELASRMVGREVVQEVDRGEVVKKEPVLEIENLGGKGLDNLSLTLRKGEIIAIVGVGGNGQNELVDVVTGAMAPEKGTVRLLDQEWKQFFKHPSWRGTVAHIPEDRLGMATCPDLDLTDNVLLTTRRGFAPKVFLNRTLALDVTKTIIRRFHVACPGPQAHARQLSGGNLQKLVLGREFFRRPQIIVAEQPSQGLDISATEEVWHRLLNARTTAGVLLVTGDLNEALQLADRVAVMFKGRFMDVFDASDEKKVDSIGLLMAGISQ
ncbi:ABC transporter ATP-binding protein [Desulfovibrio ferrophilus]|uniref:Monosaccharide-transporting ATPase n=1 Tax=Desulfovibrio ferrophilus TaxID=241368 RepID=A0A2Z6AUW2_9BACT|nr:ABC transporter ATP-binding protein [Desulfovibrio ferrophilus]BBD07021.1 monosaccharide-transporting ATPase [Desulfovibrio ferrophilus]